jgi:hypothetical protein
MPGILAEGEAVRAYRSRFGRQHLRDGRGERRRDDRPRCVKVTGGLHDPTVADGRSGGLPQPDGDPGWERDYWCGGECAISGRSRTSGWIDA